MANSFFKFKQFTIHQDRSAMKVTTDACLFGAWVAGKMEELKPCNILDAGAGTGLLSLMLAQKNDTLIDAIEIDNDAFTQAVGNVNASPWKERINIIHGDIKNLTARSPLYETIISNPPFYENELSSDDSKKNIAHHSGGLLLTDLLHSIKRLLDTDGRFYLLLPYKRMPEIDQLFQKHGLRITQMVLVKQSTKHDYFRIFLEGKHKDAESTNYKTTEISIWNDQQQYTPEFVDLLKDYYLYL